MCLHSTHFFLANSSSTVGFTERFYHPVLQKHHRTNQKELTTTYYNIIKSNLTFIH